MTDLLGNETTMEVARRWPPAPMYCAHMLDDGCELVNCEEHECHLGDVAEVDGRCPGEEGP